MNRRLRPRHRTVDNDLPGGVYTRLLEEQAPSLETLLARDTGGGDDVIQAGFFDPIGAQPLIEYRWSNWHYPPNLFPMVATDFSMLAASWSLPWEQARALLPSTSRIRPVRLLNGRAVIMFFAMDFRRGSLGPHREFGIAVPALLDGAHPAPAIPLFLDGLLATRLPGMCLYPVEVAVNQDRACVAGIKLFGLPKLVGTAGFEVAGLSGHASIAHNDRDMAELSVSAPGLRRARVRNLGFHGLSMLEGRLIRTTCECIGEGYRGMRGEAEIRFGDHPRYARFTELDLGPRPLEVRIFPRMNWIVWGPTDVGPV